MTVNRLKYCLLAAACMVAATLTGCSGSGNTEPDTPVTPTGPTPEPAAMHFHATTAHKSPRLSRATGTALESVYSNFGVYAFKTNRTAAIEDVMLHYDGTPYEVRYQSGAWNYELTSGSHTQYMKYWDLDSRDYTFVAYSPFSIGGAAATDSHTITLSRTGVSISAIEGNLTAGATTDWLVANYSRNNAAQVSDYDLLSTDPTTAAYLPQALTDEVPMIFHHLLAAVEFRAYTSDGMLLIIKSLTINMSGDDELSTLGDYAEGIWSYASDATADQIAGLTGLNLSVAGTSKATSTFLYELLELPQDISGKQVDVTVTTTEGDIYQGTFALGDLWASDTRYTYYLILSGGTQEIILIDIDIEQYAWREGNDIDVDEPVTNW